MKNTFIFSLLVLMGLTALSSQAVAVSGGADNVPSIDCGDSKNADVCSLMVASSEAGNPTNREGCNCDQSAVIEGEYWDDLNGIANASGVSGGARGKK